MQHTNLLPERVICCPFLIVMENPTEFFTRMLASIFDIRVRDLCRVEDARLF